MNFLKPIFNRGYEHNICCGDTYYPKLDNEVGVVNVYYQYGDVRRYGAVGDGVTDDSDAIMNAFKSQASCPVEMIIQLEHNRTYVIRKPIPIGPTSYLEGNGGTFLIDRIDECPPSYMIFFYNDKDAFVIDWEFLHIKASFTLSDPEYLRTFYLFKINNCDMFKLNAVNILYSGDDENRINMLAYDNVNKVIVEDCTFKNNQNNCGIFKKIMHNIISLVKKVL